MTVTTNDYTTILECVVGSTLHGTSVDDGLEDLDLMSVVIESPPLFIGLAPKDTWVQRTKPEGVRSEAGDIDRTVYGLRKYLSLALKGNPTILLALFAPKEFIRHGTMYGYELQYLAPEIISKQAFMPFRGYMKQQHERLMGTRGSRHGTPRPELVDRYGFDTKYAGHIIRLGMQGCELLRTGRLQLPMREENRRTVVDVRQGKYTLDQISDMTAALESDLVRAHASSPLREKPDQEFVQRWMIDKYLSHWKSNA